MKKTIWILAGLLVAMFIGVQAQAQTLNWSGLRDNDRHIINANVQWDYAASIGVGYTHRLNLTLPTALSAQFSLPAGKNTLDDFKSKVGIQTRVFQLGGFMVTAGAAGIFRKMESDYVTLKNFGGEFTAIAGYYTPRWFVAGEAAFDKAITTKVRNSETLRKLYPSIQDGWYVPTGGNFSYGIQTGYSFKSVDLYLKVGRIVDQTFHSSPTIPFYAQLGVNKRF
jgi:hypothetical protein